MMPPSLDFRSDTVTRPTPATRQAMAEAEVGDDVFGDDPTVNRLQERVADLLGKKAALFVPSGTMANLIAVRTHCRPGDELICEAGSRVYYYEQGGYAQLCGVAIRPVEGQGGVHHAHTQRLAEGIRGIEGLRLAPETVETNIVIFRVDPRLGTAPQLVERLRDHGLLVLPRDEAHLRMVTHLDVTAEDVERAIEVLRKAAGD